MKAVEIPITRQYHYICSDNEILVQLCVTYSVVQFCSRLFLRRMLCSPQTTGCSAVRALRLKSPSPGLSLRQAFLLANTTSGE